MVKETDTSSYERSQGDTCTPKGVIRRFHRFLENHQTAVFDGEENSYFDC